MASLSTCHLELVVWDGNLVKYMYIHTSMYLKGQCARDWCVSIEPVYLKGQCARDWCVSIEPEYLKGQCARDWCVSIESV